MIRPRDDHRKVGEALVRRDHEVVKDRSGKKQELLVREGSHSVGASGHRGLEDIDHALGALGDLGAYPSSTGARERHISLRYSALPSVTT
jgi:hypothetical protein